MPFDLWFSVDLGLGDICYFFVLVCSALLAWCVWQSPVPVVQQDPTVSAAGDTVNRGPNPEVVGVSQEPSSSSAPEEVPTSNLFQDREPPLTYGQSTRVKDRLNALYGKHPQGEAYRLREQHRREARLEHAHFYNLTPPESISDIGSLRSEAGDISSSSSSASGDYLVWPDVGRQQTNRP